MGAVALGMLGMLALMVLHGGTEPMALLYGDLVVIFLLLSFFNS